MSTTFPNFSNIQGYVTSTLNSRRGNPELISKLNPFVRIVSGANGGLSMFSNPDWKLLQATGTTYGTSTTAGAIGTTWGGAPINPNTGQGYRPSPVVTSLEVDQAQGGLSRKASFSVTCFTKEQMEKLSTYIMEPGFSILIEWGWGVGGYSGLRKLDAETIAGLQSGVLLNELRQKSGGNYDAYLGFITGGGVSLDGDKWTINVNCTGYTELPLYLLNTETGTAKTGAASGESTGAELFGEKFIKNQVNSSLDSGTPQINFMRMFNELPKSRQTIAVRNLLLDPTVTSKQTFINFDTDVSEKVSDKTSGEWFGYVKSDIKVGGKEVAFPIGTKIAAPDRFIRFDAAMRIIYQIGIKGYKLADGTIVTFKVDYENTLCSAFKHIFSTDGSKLFIPNTETPHFKLSGGASTGGKKVDQLFDDTKSNSISGIVFPETVGTTLDLGDGSLPITKEAYEAGYLKNLYINFDFFKSVLDTDNFSLKDSLYQLLNGMSSAVNGMWDFQIDESYVKETKTNILKIWEMNLISNGSKGEIYTFEMVGEKSVFIDASLDLDVSGMKMNQIIARKSAAAVSLNASAPDIGNGVWGTKLTADLLRIEIIRNDAAQNTDKVGNSQAGNDAEELAEDNLNLILDKVRYYPKETLNIKKPFPSDLLDMCYQGVFRDSAVFNAFLNKKQEVGGDTSTPLMPINFTFKVHGVSGIRRGDMFKVNGIPSIYKQNGFFQVVSIKHSIEGMQWTTEVTGGWRNNK